MSSASEKLEGHGRVHFLPELGAPNVAVQVAHESIPLLHLRPHSHVLSLNLHRLSPTEVQPPMIAVGHAMGPLQAHVVVGLAAVIPKIGDARRWQTADALDVPFEFVDEVRLVVFATITACLLYTSPSPRDKRQSRMPSSA